MSSSDEAYKQVLKNKINEINLRINALNQKKLNAFNAGSIDITIRGLEKEKKILTEQLNSYVDYNQRRKLDIIKGYTGKGIHRDDLKLYINDKDIEIYGSQGQHRSSILSIKLSELEIIKDEVDENPILLLDDFMSELDKERRENFLEDVKDTQIIITCTDKLELKNENKSIFYVENGKVSF